LDGSPNLEAHSAAATRFAPGLSLGVAIWAAPLLTLGPALRLDPGPVAISLILALAGAILGRLAYQRSDGTVGVMGGGAILGAGIALSQGAMLLAACGADIDLDSIVLPAGWALASALSVATFTTWRGCPSVAAKAGALACALAGAVACAVLYRTTLAIDPTASGGISSGVLAPVSLSASLLVLAARVWLRRRSEFTPATTAQAWRGSSRPSPARRQAGTVSPRP
jgi:hypothetical protein